MNIFVTSPLPSECAKALDDKRVVKMVLETCQMLSTAVNICGGESWYKNAHVNHPCSIWARESKGNYEWLLDLFKALCAEYTLRYGKVHKCEEHWEKAVEGASLLPEGGLTPFVNCTPYKSERDVFLAYQLCLCDKWENDKREPSWYGEKR